MKAHPFRKLSTRLIAAILALLLASIVVVSSIWYFSMSSVIERDALRNIQASVSSIRMQLDSSLRSAISIANQMSYSNTKYLQLIEKGPYGDDGSFNTLTWELENYMSSFFAFSENILGIVIISPSGYLFQSGLRVSPSYGIYEKPFVREILRGDTHAIFAPQNEHMYSSIMHVHPDTLSVLTPIKVSGRVYGAVMLNLDYSTITALIDRTPLPDGTRIVSLMRDNQLLMDSMHPTVTALQSDDYALPDELIQLNSAGGDGGTLGIRIDGRDTLVVREHSDYSSITLMGVIEEGVLLTSVNDVFSVSLAGLMIAMLPLTVMLILLILYITRGLHTLRGTMAGVRDAGTGVRAQVRGNDEVAELALTFNQMMGRIDGLVEDIRNKEEEKRKAEREVYRAQINPHFVYNTLGTIRHLAVLRGARNIENITVLLTQLLRASLDDTRELVPLSTEVEFARRYMDLQKYRYLDDIRANIELMDGVEAALVPRMILQPLLENALIHGFEGSNKRGTIHVDARRMSDDLVITVRDDGKGIPPDLLEHLLDGDGTAPPQGHASIGLRNVHHRLRLAFGDGYGLRIDSVAGSYTEVTAVMPHRTEDENG